jgi:hypothetical protein
MEDPGFQERISYWYGKLTHAQFMRLVQAGLPAYLGNPSDGNPSIEARLEIWLHLLGEEDFSIAMSCCGIGKCLQSEFFHTFLMYWVHRIERYMFIQIVKELAPLLLALGNAFMQFVASTDLWNSVCSDALRKKLKGFKENFPGRCNAVSPKVWQDISQTDGRPRQRYTKVALPCDNVLSLMHQGLPTQQGSIPYSEVMRVPTQQGSIPYSELMRQARARPTKPDWTW